MKNLRTYVLCACMVYCSLGSDAQNRPPVNEPDLNRPKLFAGMPDRVAVSTDELEGLFGSTAGRPAQLRLPLTAHTQFEGEVMSISERTAEGQQSLMLKSTNFTSARFSLSRMIADDGSVIYRGRIMSFQHGDLYELQKLDGQYYLVKRNFYDIVNE